MVWPTRHALWTWVSTALENNEGDRREPVASGVGGMWKVSQFRANGKLFVGVTPALNSDVRANTVAGI